MPDALRLIAAAAVRAATGSEPDALALERICREVQLDLSSRHKGETLKFYVAGEPTSVRVARAHSIRSAVAAGLSLRVVADRYGVSTRQVRRLVTGR